MSDLSVYVKYMRVCSDLKILDLFFDSLVIGFMFFCFDI